jgi:hypothetical protein
MSDRYNAFVVILENDIRDDDAKATIKAIEQIKGVLRVTPHIADINESIAESRVKNELFNKIFDLLRHKED